MSFANSCGKSMLGGKSSKCKDLGKEGTSAFMFQINLRGCCAWAHEKEPEISTGGWGRRSDRMIMVVLSWAFYATIRTLNNHVMYSTRYIYMYVDIHTHIPYRILFSIMVLMGCYIWFSVLNNRTLLLIPNLGSWACLLHSPKSSTFNLFNLTFEPSWITSSVLNMLRAFSPLCPRPFF